MKRLSFAVQTALLAVTVSAPLAHATLLTPGTGCLVCTNFANATPGTVIATTGVENFSISLGVTVKESGTFESQVIRTSSGYLDFYYQVTLTKGTLDDIATSDFTGWSGAGGFPGVDVGTNKSYSVFGGGKFGTESPSSISVTPDGATVNFNYQDVFGNANFKPGTSVTLVVDTDATAYQAGTTSLIDSGVDTVNSFAPGPEPSSIALFGSVLVIGGYAMRRRIARR